ncbi:acid phosphatase [Flavobacterium akiainvivens]|uniref:acid phosphatase n=1 Tax=Flavobacterium akiainvivens TaxID=1202724 RepID=A0A0M8MDJ2_9FLAO|nr:metallophosphoesterase [Flavobacterium akiainvivens]KOS06584.1 acid phosphatase [Flavobacterium akiainvivens]SFQ09930.1 Calcineurin-like phosphoesterase [Flavobacterium akiainvivens]
MKKLLLLLLTGFVSFSIYSQEYLAEEKSGYREGFIPELKLLDKSLNFVALGDFGRFGQYYQKPVAEQMGKAAMTIESDFTVCVGDNFYPNGVQSTEDHQWISSFENIYTNMSLHNDWYVALGNHDYRGSIQAQLDYTKVSRRWQMPDKYYSKTFDLDNGDKVLMVVMDTNPYIDSYRKPGMMYENIIAQDTLAQTQWLTETLKNADEKVKWKIVVGHHPLYSGGKRKTNPDTIKFAERFAGVFDTYRVDAYICGHEHDLQIIKPKGRYTTQFLSGAASEVRPTGKTEGTLFAESQAGFMTFSITSNKLLVQVVNHEGKILYTTEINKK